MLKITKAAAKRALRALLILDQANASTEDFPCRQYDNCFEAGDGTQVVCEIMRRAFERQPVMRIMQRYPACRYVDIEGWTKTYNENMTESGVANAIT